MRCTGGRCSATASCCAGGPCPVSALRGRVLGHSTDVTTRCTGGLCQLLRPLRRWTGSSRCVSLHRWSVFSQALAPAFPGSPASSFPFLRGYASRASEDVKTTKTASGHAAPPFGRMPAVDVQPSLRAPALLRRSFACNSSSLQGCAGQAIEEAATTAATSSSAATRHGVPAVGLQLRFRAPDLLVETLPARPLPCGNTLARPARMRWLQGRLSAMLTL